MKKKTNKKIDEAIQKIMENYPQSTRIEILCMGKIENEFKKNPNVIRKKRWFYYNYNGKLLYLHFVHLKLPKCNTIHIEKVTKPTLVQYAPPKVFDKTVEQSVWNTFKWEPFELHQGENKNVK